MVMVVLDSCTFVRVRVRVGVQHGLSVGVRVRDRVRVRVGFGVMVSVSVSVRVRVTAMVVVRVSVRVRVRVRAAAMVMTLRSSSSYAIFPASSMSCHHPVVYRGNYPRLFTHRRDFLYLHLRLQVSAGPHHRGNFFCLGSRFCRRDSVPLSDSDLRQL
jgi:hypothetical protein